MFKVSKSSTCSHYIWRFAHVCCCCFPVLLVSFVCHQWSPNPFPVPPEKGIGNQKKRENRMLSSLLKLLNKTLFHWHFFVVCSLHRRFHIERKSLNLFRVARSTRIIYRIILIFCFLLRRLQNLWAKEKTRKKRVRECHVIQSAIESAEIGADFWFAYLERAQ